MTFRRIHAGDSYLIPCEGGYVKGYAESDGFLLRAEPVDLFLSDEDVAEMHIAARVASVETKLGWEPLNGAEVAK